MNTWIPNTRNNYSHQCNYYQRAKKMIKKSVKKPAANKLSVKKASKKKSTLKKTSTADPAMTILQTSKCKTVTGKSDLTYNIALDEKGNAMIRIASNTGGGFWSKEYVHVSVIINAIESVPEDQSITSVHLFKVFTGRSQNSPGFLLAVMLAEGVLEPLGKKRQYRVSESGVDKFLAKVDKLKEAE